MYIKTIAAVGLLAATAACTNDPAERALVGAGIGGGAGAAAGQLIANDPWTGALGGAAVGAAAGALTDDDDVDISDWFD